MSFPARAAVAVVIPVHNGISYTALCLRALRSLTEPPFMVIVVDDGSSDGTSQYLQTDHPDVTVIPGSGDLWWSGAVNLGCRFAIEHGARTLILLNNDNVAVSDNCFSELERVVAQTGGCASAVVLEELADGTRRIRQAGGSLRWEGRGVSLRDYGTGFAKTDRQVACDWLPGCALAFDSNLFDELGGFDAHRFPQYRGDIDFTLRAKNAGRPCVVSYNCWVVNDVRQSGLVFDSRVTLRQFVAGFFTLKSNYNVRETVVFALRHCPRRRVPAYLALFYMRYAYATLKTWLPSSWRRKLTRQNQVSF